MVGSWVQLIGSNMKLDYLIKMAGIAQVITAAEAAQVVPTIMIIETETI